MEVQKNYESTEYTDILPDTFFALKVGRETRESFK